MLAEMSPIQSIPSNSRKRPFGLRNDLQNDELPDFQIQNLHSVQCVQSLQSLGYCSDENSFGEATDRLTLKVELGIDRELGECILQRKEQLCKFRIMRKLIAKMQLDSDVKGSANISEVKKKSSMRSLNLERQSGTVQRHNGINCLLAQHDSKNIMADTPKKLQNTNSKKKFILKVKDIFSDESSKDDDCIGSISSTSAVPRAPRHIKQIDEQSFCEEQAETRRRITSMEAVSKSKLKRFDLRHKFQKVEHVIHLKTEQDQSFVEITRNQGAEPSIKFSANQGNPVRAGKTNVKEFDLYELHNFTINLDVSKLIKFSEILEEIERTDLKDSGQ